MLASKIPRLSQSCKSIRLESTYLGHLHQSSLACSFVLESPRHWTSKETRLVYERTTLEAFIRQCHEWFVSE